MDETIQSPQPAIIPGNRPPVSLVPERKPEGVKFDSERVKKFGLIGAAVLGGLILIYILGMLTGLDTQVFQPSFSGRVLDEQNQPIHKAEVKLGTLSTQTDSTGNFKFSNVGLALYEVNVSAAGYSTVNTKVNLTRGFLTYNTNMNFTLKSAGIATIKAKLISPDQGYLFTEDKITINDKDYAVTRDGGVEITNVPAGKQDFWFQSSNYQDIIKTLELKTGENDLGTFELVKSGEITGSLKSWLKGTTVADLQISVESVPPNQVVLDAKAGTFRIRDLEIARKYKLRINHPQYQTRDFEVGVQAGANQLFDFRIVERGLIPYLQEVDEDLHLFVSEIDGTNAKKLTAEDMEVYGEFIDGNNIYFLSTRDNVRSELGGNALLVYVTEVEGGNPQRVTTTYSNLGRIVPNFTAKKLLNVKRGSSRDARVLEYMDLSGENRVEIFNAGIALFNDVLMSNNGKSVFYQVQDKDDKITGLYYFDTATKTNKKLVTKPNTQVYSTDHTGELVLYTATNKATNLTDLYLYNVKTNQDITLRPSFTGTQYQFVNGSSEDLIYFNSKDGATNVYSLSLKTNQERKLTDFKGLEAVEAVYQQAGFILYQTNKGLYIMDFTAPLSGKQVNTSAARYTGYDF